MTVGQHAIIAVVPNPRVAAAKRAGWLWGGKGNGKSVTMVKIFPSVKEATDAGRKLPYVYTIEPFVEEKKCEAGS